MVGFTDNESDSSTTWPAWSRAYLLFTSIDLIFSAYLCYYIRAWKNERKEVEKKMNGEIGSLALDFLISHCSLRDAQLFFVTL